MLTKLKAAPMRLFVVVDLNQWSQVDSMMSMMAMMKRAPSWAANPLCGDP